MIQIKKTILTLVALLAVTTGAWADGIVCTASDLGKVLCTDGSIYENVSAATTAGKEAAAMIAYVDETNKNGLALALTDEDGQTWDNSSPSNKGKTAPEICSALNTSKAVTGGTWKMPSQDEWKQMFSANGGDEDSYTGLKTAIGNAGGTALVEGDDYWSSSEVDQWDAWLVNLSDGNASWDTYGKHYSRCIRACLAFDIAASSGPEVAWNKAEKTGQFTMPGGNVTLEPEYYTQATVADGGVTAADADARATTDDPLVKVDATKLTGAKKLMYFVSNSGTTAPAYDAEGWTDQLPTAEGFTQQGIVYVWYYPVGTDEGVDGATATYSDGDICLQSITARIADAPTYAVTFAEGTDPNEWTADPAADVKKGQTVTVTYTGSKKVIGVKAEKKAAAPSVPDGAISGVFSVSSTKKVYFSKGNLRYASGAWSFFDNQYDYYNSYSADAWDKFGWSKSATTYGMNTSTSSSTYSGDFVDWGATMGAGWFTLSKDEWTYLLNTRSASTVGGTENGRYAKAKVNNVQGIILFPDTYTHPDGVTAPTGVNATNNTGWNGNNYDATAWAKMESAGCAFLPAAGYRWGSSMYDMGTDGIYWSATPTGADQAYGVYFTSGGLLPADTGYWVNGCSVRLVREVTE